MEEAIAYPIRIVVCEKNDKAAIELRGSSTDPEVIKTIISCAFHNKPIIVQPSFTDKIKAINSLLERGIVYKNSEDQQYYFTF